MSETIEERVERLERGLLALDCLITVLKRHGVLLEGEFQNLRLVIDGGEESDVMIACKAALNASGELRIMLQVLDLLVIIDTLRTSLRIVDNGEFFAYTNQARQETMLRVLKLAQKTPVSVELKSDAAGGAE